MALTVVKYRKSATGETIPATIQRKNSIIKIGDGANLIINKIPASIKPAIKRPAPTIVSQGGNPIFKSPKYALQSNVNTPISNLQWQQPTKPAPIAAAASRKQNMDSVIGALPSNTIIQPASNTVPTTTRAILSNGVTVSPVGTMQVRRPTIYIKRDTPARSMRQMTMDLIEKNPKLHLGLDTKRLQVLKNVISASTGIPLPDCYLTLRKLRQNEDCAVLGELFEISEEQVQKTVARSIASFARFMRSLLYWPDAKKYYERHKELPFEFRHNLNHVQSLIETVETEMRLQPNIIECQSYKFILCITPTGIVTYVSDAYLGKYDDLTIFAASKFNEVIPKYLTLMVEPGKGVRRKKTKNLSPNNYRNSVCHTDSTDSADEFADERDNEEQQCRMSKYAAQRLAGELAAEQSLSVVNNKLCSTKVKDFSIPTMRVAEPSCRERIRDTIDRMREFQILRDCSLKEPIMFQYLNEIIVVVAAFSNLLLE